ncbi:MAG: AtpZ/AtpI family protein [Deltaproteobacteria bacterium]|nr:MAG: AtpZ/AtpI family protein [Deltaproteobacteria bacterium]
MKLLEHAAVGVEFAACVVIGMFMGSYLDRWLDTEPWMTFLFTIFGFAAGIRALLRAYRIIEREEGASPSEDKSDHGDGSRNA